MLSGELLAPSAAAHRDALRLRARLLGHDHLQQPVLHTRLDGGVLDLPWQADLPDEVPSGQLTAHVCAFLGFAFLSMLSPDCEGPLGKGHLDLVWREAGDGGLDAIVRLGLANVDRKMQRGTLLRIAGMDCP